jgi:FAD-linked oxidoreductase
VPVVTRQQAPRWTDWSGRQECNPALVLRPGSEEELVGAVRRAAGDGLVVRPIGSGHSFSPVCVTDDVQLDVSRLDELLGLDPATGVARVQAGMTLRRLSAELHLRGRALTNLGDVDTQTVAGALATATHGTGATFPNLSAAMVGGRLVAADGTVHDLATADPDLLLAARVSLGALGVLSEVHLQTVPAFRLHKVERPRPLTDLLADLAAVATGDDHVELYALPWSRTALLLTSRRTDEPAAPPARWRTWLTDELLNNTGLGVLQRTGRRFPGLQPSIGRLTGVVASGSERLDDSHKVFASNRRVRFTESEWSLPRAAAAEAVRGVLRMIERRRLPVSFPVEVRFAAADDALLSTASGRDSAYVAVHQFVGVDDSAYFRHVEDLMLGLDGRPHWGKKHATGADVLAPRYPGWARFQAVRDRLDPTGVFTSPHVEHVLGPAAALRAAS